MHDIFIFTLYSGHSVIIKYRAAVLAALLNPYIGQFYSRTVLSVWYDIMNALIYFLVKILKTD
jgi:hypothetical protein